MLHKQTLVDDYMQRLTDQLALEEARERHRVLQTKIGKFNLTDTCELGRPM